MMACNELQQLIYCRNYFWEVWLMINHMTVQQRDTSTEYWGEMSHHMVDNGQYSQDSYGHQEKRMELQLPQLLPGRLMTNLLRSGEKRKTELWQMRLHDCHYFYGKQDEQRVLDYSMWKEGRREPNWEAGMSLTIYQDKEVNGMLTAMTYSIYFDYVLPKMPDAHDNHLQGANKLWRLIGTYWVPTVYSTVLHQELYKAIALHGIFSLLTCLWIRQMHACLSTRYSLGMQTLKKARTAYWASYRQLSWLLLPGHAWYFILPEEW